MWCILCSQCPWNSLIFPPLFSPIFFQSLAPIADFQAQKPQTIELFCSILNNLKDLSNNILNYSSFLSYSGGICIFPPISLTLLRNTFIANKTLKSNGKYYFWTFQHKYFPSANTKKSLYSTGSYYLFNSSIYFNINEKGLKV